MYEGDSRTLNKFSVVLFLRRCKGREKTKAPPIPCGTSGAIFLACGIKFFNLWYYLCNFCGIIYVHALHKRVHFILNIKLNTLLELQAKLSFLFQSSVAFIPFLDFVSQFIYSFTQCTFVQLYTKD